MNYYKGGKDSCNGDSGGALVCDVNGKATFLATVSWGYKCALDGYPGIYVQIDKYESFKTIASCTKRFISNNITLRMNYVRIEHVCRNLPSKNWKNLDSLCP